MARAGLPAGPACCMKGWRRAPALHSARGSSCCAIRAALLDSEHAAGGLRCCRLARERNGCVAGLADGAVAVRLARIAVAREGWTDAAVVAEFALARARDRCRCTSVAI